MRTTPLQSRSTARITQFLDAAAAIIAEVGFDALTMTAVAERAGSSIGALYRWFPDREALAHELRTRYRGEIDELLANLVREADAMTLPEFSDALIDRIVEFTYHRPAWIPLLDALVIPARDPAARKHLRDELARAFRTYVPDLALEQASRMASVAMGIVKGLVSAFRTASEPEKIALNQEFKVALRLYLEHAILNQPDVSS